MKKQFLTYLILILYLSLKAQNNALYFDGTGDYISVPNNSEFNFGSGDFTISFWINFADINKVHDGIFGRDDFQWLAMEYNHDGDKRLNLWIDKTGTSGWELNNLKPTKNNWVQNQWYHIAVVRDINTIKIYIDGTLATTSAFSGSIFNPTVPLYFGRSQLATRFHFGRMDDIRIWKYALSEADIKSSKNIQITGTEPGLIAYWKCNETSGLVASDVSNNSFLATLNNDASFVASTAPNNQVAVNPPFKTVRPTGLPYNIVVTDLKINGKKPPVNTQIGVYDDTLCVGSAIYDSNSNLQIVAWQRDSALGLQGFKFGRPITFKVRTIWFSKIEIFNASASYSQGNGLFGTGTFSVVTLSATNSLAPDIEFLSTLLNYNAVSVGTSVIKDLIIQNTGNTNLNISNISSPIPEYVLSKTSSLLAAGAKDTVKITFTPTAVLDYEKILTITSDDPDESISTLILNGTGLPVPTPQIVLSPNTLYFGGIATGSNSIVNFNILNIGDGNLSVTNITSNNAAFTITSPTSFSLAQGQNKDVSVRFSSATVGTYSATITITTTSGNSVVAVSGFTTQVDFTAVQPTGLPYHLLIEKVEIDTIYSLKYGDEVAVYDNSLCVGSAIVGGGKALACQNSNDYLQIPSISLPSSYTLEGWILFPLPATSGGWRTIFFSSSSQHHLLFSSTGELGLYSGNFYSSGYNASTLTGWHHVAMVCKNSKSNFYIDGNLKGSVNIIQANPIITIGNSAGSQNIGFVDEIRIWGTARTDDQIKELMNKKATGLENGLIANWSFTGGSLSDNTANKRVGTLINSAKLADNSILTDVIDLVAWQKDVSRSMPGFTIGNSMSFKVNTNLYAQNLLLNTTPSYISGNGNFGTGSFSALTLKANTLLYPNIHVSTKRVYTGQVEINKSIKDTFYIRNNGNAQLSINLFENSAEFSISSIVPTLAIGDSVAVVVTFTPLTAGSFTTNLTINSNDPDSAVIIIPLEGFAIPVGIPNIALSSGAVNFDGVITNSSKSIVVNIINSGTAPLNVTGITSNNAAFTVSPTSFTLNNTNDNKQISISFNPSYRGLFTGTLTITSNATTKTINVKGIGYDGHFNSVNTTGLPYNIVVTKTNLFNYIKIGDEISVYDDTLCVGTSAVLQDTGNILVVAWKSDPARSLKGFINGHFIKFKIWSKINGFDSEFDATSTFSVGNGTYGFGQFSVANLLFSLPQIKVEPTSMLVALKEPDSTTKSIKISNTGNESLNFYKTFRYTSGVNNILGKSAFFDGVNDYISLPSYSNGGKWTIESWVNPSSLPSGRRTIFGAVGSCIDWSICMIDGYLGSSYRQIGGCSANIIYNQKAEINKWYHVAATCDGDSVRLFINGDFIKSAKVENNYVGLTSIAIGYASCCGEYFPGLIDEVRLWNVVRSNEEIFSTLTDTINTNRAGLVGYWNFDNNNVNDLKGSRNGTLNNGAVLNSLNAPLFNWLKFVSTKDSIVAMQNKNILLNFNSNGLLDGLYNAEIIIFNNTLDNSKVIIPITLNVTGKAQLKVSVDSFSYGKVIVGIKDTIDFTLQNMGSKNLDISNIFIKNGASTDFSLVGNVSFPFTLIPVEQKLLAIKFTPDNDGFRSDTLIIKSNDSTSLTKKIAIKGIGQTPPDIDLSMTSWKDTMSSAKFRLDTIYIRNKGQAVLSYTITEKIPWLSVSQQTGTVSVSDSIAIVLNISTLSVYAGKYKDTIRISSNDFDEPLLNFIIDLTVFGKPIISTTGGYNFGNVELNKTALVDFTVNNKGTDTLKIDSVKITDPIFVLVSKPIKIHPGKSGIIKLSFTPTLDIAYSAILTIKSNALNAVSIDNNIQGRGIKAQDISVSPISFNRSVQSGDVRTYTMTISNAGGKDLNYTLSNDNLAGNAMRFDGNGDYINILNNTVLNPDTAITLEAWINPEDLSREYIIAKELTGVGSYRLYINNNGYFQFTLNGDKSVVSTIKAVISQWQHIAASFDGNTMSIYINGILNNSVSFPYFTIQPNTENLRIGRSFSSDYFKGLIDEIKIWNVAFNETEVRSFMNQSIAGNENGLVFYYRFDETAGNITHDDSPYGNNGTLYGNTIRIESTVLIDHFFSITPTFGTVPPFSSRNILLSVDATGYYVRTLNQNIKINSNDNDEPEINVPFVLNVGGARIASVVKDTLQFVSTFLGFTDTVILVIKNTGADYLSLSNWIHKNSAFKISSKQTSLRPFSEKRIAIVFSPTTAGLIKDTLLINTNDASHSQLKVILQGNGIQPPVFSVKDTLVDFGPIIVPLLSDTVIKIYNKGSAPLIISSITSSIPTVFTIANSPITINGGDSASITISYIPSDYLIYNGSIVFNTNIGKKVIRVNGFGIRAGNDVGIISLVSPSSGCGLGDSIEVRVLIRNFGSSPQTGFNIGYILDGKTPIVENVGALSIPIGSSRYFTFSIPANLSTIGTHSLKIYSSLINDQALTNDTIKLIISNYPELAIVSSNDAVICQGQTITLAVAAPLSTYTWSTGSHNSYINVNPSISTSYYVTAVNSNGCIDNDTIKVSVHSLPPTPVVTAMGSTVICAYDSLLLNSSISQVKWNNNKTGNSTYVKQTGLWYATNTDTNNCSSVSNSINVITEAVPTISISGPTTICRGDNTTLTATNAVSYLWSTGQNSKTINILPDRDSVFYVYVTTTNSCKFKDSINIYVINPTPPGQVGSMLPIDASLSVFKPIQFSWSPATNASNYDIYIWEQYATKPLVPSISNLNSINYSYNASSLNYGTTYKWQVVSRNSCFTTEGPQQTFTLRYLPDLVIGNILSPLTIYSGQNLTLSWETTNIGEGSTNSQQWDDAVYLSLDSTLSSDDIFVGSTSNLSYLVKGQSYSQTATFTIPSSIIGNYYVIVKADHYNNLDENNESNNYNYDKDAIITISPKPKADLIVNSIGVPTSIFSGNKIMVNYQVKNISATQAQGNSSMAFYLSGSNYYEKYWYDAIYISANPVFKLSTSLKLKDVYVGLRSAKNATATNWYSLPDYLDEDSVYSKVIQVTIPHSYAGNYYIYVLSDSYDNVEENAENNNLLHSLPINVILSPPADLIVDTINVPYTAQSGQTISVNYTIKNKGGNAPIETTWKDRIYISTLDTFNAQQAILMSEQIINNGNLLNPDEVYTKSIPIKIPDGISGLYNVFVLTDFANDVFEYTYNGNNSRKSDKPIQVTLAPYPDLKPDSLIKANDTLFAGSTYVIRWNVKNYGPAIANAPWTDRIYISSDPVWNLASATKLASIDRTQNLVTNAGYSQSIGITIPLGITGTNYLYIVTDINNTIFEHLAENNNAKGILVNCKDTFKTVIPTDTTRTNLALTLFTSPSNAMSGNIINVSWTVENKGNRPSIGSWYDHIYLSSDPTLSSNDILLGYLVHNGKLYPGENYSSSKDVLIPNGLSAGYYLIMAIDPTAQNTSDSSRKNNYITNPIALTLAPAADLIVNSFSLPSSYIAGQQVKIPFTIRNNGVGSTREGIWQEAFYISPTPDLTSGYYHVATFNHNGNLNSGGSYSDTVLVTIPAYLSGFYYFIARTDAYNKVYEHNGETNNDKVSYLQIIVPDPSDIIVSQINIPTSVNLGENVNVSYVIKNVGSNPATGNLSDAIYFSSDKIFNSIGDKLLKTQQGFINISPGDSVTRFINNKMPGVVPGGYYGVGRTNLLNSIVESNINNNISISDDTISVSVNQLFLNIPDSFKLDVGDLVYYKVIVGKDLDLLITLNSNLTNGSNEIYVAYNRVPSVNDFDYLFDAPNKTNQKVLIPSTKQGTYYILVKTAVNYYGLQNTIILAKALPFSVLSVNPDTVGTGVVTTRIEGAGFRPYTRFYILDKDSNVVDSAVIKSFQNSMQVLVQWNFSDDSTKTYHVKAVNNDTTKYIKTDAIVIEESSGFRIDFNYVSPNMIRINSKGTFSFYYENIGNVDIPFIKGDYTIPTYTKLINMSAIGNVYRRSQLVADTSLGLLNDWVDYDNFRHIPLLIKDLAPGEVVTITVSFRDFGNSSLFPLRVRAYGFSKEGYLKNQLAMAEGTRLSMLQNPVKFGADKNILLLNLANKRLTWRDSIIKYHFDLGLLKPSDTIGFNLGCTECTKGYTTTGADKQYTFDPGLSPGSEQYKQTSFNSGEDYMWEINKYNGTAGIDPGWDLVKVNDELTINATKQNPFVIHIASLNYNNESAYLAGWYPGAAKCWPIAIADGGITGFNEDKFIIDFADFSAHNKLYNGKFSLTLAGTDTLLLCFSGDTLANTVQPSPEHIVTLPPTNIPCGLADNLGQLTCEDVFRTSTCSLSEIGCFNSFILESSKSLTGTKGLSIALFGTSTCGLGISNCSGLSESINYKSPDNVQGIDLLGCMSSSSTNLSVNCNGQYICTQLVRSCDPNDIIGPRGYGAGRYISIHEILPYTIRFENDSVFATTAAQRVTIKQKLDNNIDPLSFRVKDFGFADHTFKVSYNTASYFTTINMPDSLGYDIELTAGIDISKNEVFWIFQTIDPSTGLPPTNPLLGFLDVNDAFGSGEGFVNYTVKSSLNSLSGDSIHAKAEIIFDINPAIITPQIFNRIDIDKPVSYVDLLPAKSDSTSIPIRIVGIDEAKGSGVGYYKLYVAENTGKFRHIGDYRPNSAVTFNGNVDAAYKYFSIAVDNVGHIEPMKYFEEAVTVVKLANIKVTPTIKPISCFGLSDGEISLNVVGGTKPYQFSWNNGSTSQHLTSIQAGTYSVTVKDVNDSVTKGVYVVTQPIKVDVNLGKDTIIVPGTIITLNAGSNYDNYLWQDSSVNSTFNVDTIGTYFVKAGLNNCFDSDTIKISGVTTLTIVPSITHISCNGLTDGIINTFVAGGKAPYQYIWSNGNNTNSITNLNASVYSVTVKDANNSTVTGIYTITQPLPIAIDLGLDTFILPNTSALIDAGLGYNSYEWSTGSYSSNISVNTTAVIWVKVELNGCYASDTIKVTVLPPFKLPNDTVFGCSNVPIVITAATGYDSYSWSNGQNKQTATFNTSGKYYITVTKAASIEIDSVHVIIYPSPVVNLGKDTTIKVNQSLTLKAPAGYADYEWSDLSTNTNLIVNGAIGQGIYNYHVVVTAANGCKDTDTIKITVAPASNILMVNNNIFSVRAYPNPTSGIVNLDIKYLNEALVVKITNMLNQELFETTITTNSQELIQQIDISNLPDGIYMLLLKSGNIEMKGKIIKLGN